VSGSRIFFFFVILINFLTIASKGATGFPFPAVGAKDHCFSSVDEPFVEPFMLFLLPAWNLGCPFLIHSPTSPSSSMLGKTQWSKGE